MPLNRTTDIKKLVTWLLVILKARDQEKRLRLKLAGESPRSPVEALTGVPLSVPEKVPSYIPGINLVPIPEAGWCLGYVDIAFWAVFSYFVGSIAYMVNSFYVWSLTYDNVGDDASNPGIYWNTVASGMFIVNALLCIVDWYLQYKQLSALNMTTDELTGGLLLESIPVRQSIYYFFNNLFFLAAALVYMIESVWYENYELDTTNCTAGFCDSFWMQFLGSIFYLISSSFSLLEFWDNYLLRKQQGLPPLKLFSCEMHRIDWFGWGDILYFAVSVVAFAQTFLESFYTDSDDFIAPYYTIENFLFLLDSAAYLVAYLLYMYDLRQALITGLVDESNTGLRAFVGEDVRSDIKSHHDILGNISNDTTVMIEEADIYVGEDNASNRGNISSITTATRVDGSPPYQPPLVSSVAETVHNPLQASSAKQLTVRRGLSRASGEENGFDAFSPRPHDRAIGSIRKISIVDICDRLREAKDRKLLAKQQQAFMSNDKQRSASTGQSGSGRHDAIFARMFSYPSATNQNRHDFLDSWSNFGMIFSTATSVNTNTDVLTVTSNPQTSGAQLSHTGSRNNSSDLNEFFGTDQHSNADYHSFPRSSSFTGAVRSVQGLLPRNDTAEYNRNLGSNQNASVSLYPPHIVAAQEQINSLSSSAPRHPDLL